MWDETIGRSQTGRLPGARLTPRKIAVSMIRRGAGLPLAIVQSRARVARSLSAENGTAGATDRPEENAGYLVFFGGAAGGSSAWIMPAAESSMASGVTSTVMPV